MTQRASGDGAHEQPLVEALAAVLRPLARLAVARGLPFAQARTSRAAFNASLEASADWSALIEHARRVSTGDLFKDLQLRRDF